MTTKCWSEIRDAADAGLILCLNSKSPADKLERHLAELRRLGWDDEAVAQVEYEISEALPLLKNSEIVAAH